MPFAHRSFAVYRLALQLSTEAAEVARALPKEWRAVADQLLRAAVSVQLNIAEGAGEHSPKEKARFYRIARRSAFETSAVLDLLRALGHVPETRASTLDSLAERIAGHLTRIAKTMEQRPIKKKREQQPIRNQRMTAPILSPPPNSPPKLSPSPLSPREAK